MPLSSLIKVCWKCQNSIELAVSLHKFLYRLLNKVQVIKSKFSILIQQMVLLFSFSQ